MKAPSENAILDEYFNINFKPSIIQRVGKERIERLKNILEDETLVEIDLLHLNGVLSREEVYWYCLLEPYFQETRGKFLALIEEITQDVFNERSILYCLSRTDLKRKAQGGFGISSSNNIMELAQLMIDLPHALLPNLQGADIRATLSIEMLKRFLQNFMQHAGKIYRTNQKAGRISPEEVKRLITITTSFLSDSAKKHWKIPDRIWQSYALSIPAIEDHLSKYQSVITEATNGLEESRDLAEIYFEEIRDLASFRVISNVHQDFGSMEVELYGDFIPDTYLRMTRIGAGRLILDSNRKHKPASLEQGTLVVTIQEGCLDFTIDRSNGEIYGYFTDLPLSRFLPPEVYQKLRCLVFELYYSQLTEAEDTLILEYEQEIRRLLELYPKENPVAEQVTETNEAIEEAIFPEAPTPVESASVNDIKTPSSKEDTVIRYRFSDFRNLSAHVAFSAIERICGSPLSQSGSHRKYEYKGARRTIFPAQKQNGTIAPASLKAFLEGVDIPRPLFLAEIGRDHLL